MNHRRWSPLAEYALFLGSGAGAVASVATQNATVASLPITALVALGLINRRRLEQHLQMSNQALADLEQQLGTRVSQLSAQVSALPTPEALTQCQRQAMAHSDRAVVRFSEALQQTRRDLEQRLKQSRNPDLSHLYQDTAQLQDQYTYVCATLNSLTKQIERLAHLPRLEAAETDIAQLKTDMMQLRVGIETLGGENKISLATLQDAIRHLDRRLRQIPSSADPNLLKEEVRELTKAVADLVPRREFLAIAEKLQAIHQTQESFRRQLDQVRTAQAAGQSSLGASDLKDLQTRLEALATHLGDVEERLQTMAVPFDITAEIRGTTATYLSSLQWQFARLEQQTQELWQQQQRLNAASLSREALPPAAAGRSEVSQWISTFRGETTNDPWSAIEQALFQALDQVHERLVLVWPWSPALPLDSPLMHRFTDILARGCRLEIGWCYPGDRRQGRLLKSIAQQWQLPPVQRQLLKTTLHALLPLKKQYPDQFRCKILGTDEQFLVCDRAYAVIGLKSLPTMSSPFPDLDVRVRTTAADVIQGLLQRFDHPEQLPENSTVYFNRAITRYDLRDLEGAIADFSRVLRLTPNDAVTLNNRGILWVEKRSPQRALADFSQALALDPHLFAAGCNRGWLWLQQQELQRAIADFDRVIQTHPQSAIPFFYRGIARQRLGDSLGAIADYTQAIRQQPQVALPYCYRGAVYQQQGDWPWAIADLETAASLLHAQANHRALAQVTQVLSALKQASLTRSLSLHSA